MPYVTSIQSVTGGISLSVSQNWSIAVWYFVDSKLTLPVTSPNVTDFKNYFTGRLTGKFATNSYLNTPPHLKYVATLPCEI